MNPQTIDKVFIRPAQSSFKCNNPECRHKPLRGHVIITYTGLLQQHHKNKTTYTYHAACAKHELEEQFAAVRLAYSEPITRDYLLKLPPFYVVPRQFEWGNAEDEGMQPEEGAEVIRVEGSFRVSKRPFQPHCNLLEETAAIVDVKGDGHCLGHVLEYFGITTAENLRLRLLEFYRRVSTSRYLLV